jgi:hypothetical protein
MTPPGGTGAQDRLSVATVAELGHAGPEDAEGRTQEPSFPEPIAP